ncbi:MAG TPA: hypothetical protein VLE02_06665 [Nitrosarchaeum sp.]|nr:hypothetical protein [Nitrosarchaeum sp.]
MSQITKIKDSIKIRSVLKKQDKYFDDDTESRNIYHVYVTYNKKTISFKFGDSIHNTQMGIELDNESVLSTIVSDYYCPDNFSEFCSEYGYDEDSRKAEKTFRLCKLQSSKLHELFEDADIEKLNEEVNA